MINDKQKEVIYEAKTPAAIIAGPGTGKTFTIVKKVIELIKVEGIAANKILITTFTKKAAKELNTRIISEFKRQGLNSNLIDLKIGNFHSLANIYIDKYKKLDDDFFKEKVIDSYFEQYLLEKNLSIFEKIDGFDKYLGANKVLGIQGIFAEIINNLIDLEILKNSKDPKDRFAYEIYQSHLKLLKDKKMLNFQMILKNFYDLLTDEEIGDQIRKSIDFVIIDEYQDTNFIQQEIAFKLLKDKNIMVFGDDDQALYRFRGADPKNITNFDEICQEKLGVSANFYKLDINYRSNQAIIDKAQKFLNSSGIVAKKEIVAFDENENANCLVRARADNFENLYKIIKILNKKIALNQIGFLFPTLNSNYPKNLQNYLERKGLKVLNLGRSQFFDRNEIRILIYILVKIFSSYPSNLSYQKDLSYEDMQKLYFRRYLAELFDDQSFKNYELDSFIKNIRNNDPKTISQIIYKAFALKNLQDILGKKLGDLENDRALNNIGTFTKLVSEYEEIFASDRDNYFLEFIYGYIFYFFKNNSIKEFDEIDKTYDAINFMTIHNSKGLEFDVVFVSGLNDFPRANSRGILDKYKNQSKEKNLEEIDFYRKYYTAFTRAKNLLVILDNSIDPRIIDFANNLDDSSKLSTINFIRYEEKIEKEILAFTTDIEIYESCPLKYKFLRKLKFTLPKSHSLIFGSRVHQICQYIGENRDNPKLDYYLNIFLEKNPAYKNAIRNFREKKFPILASEVNYKADRDFYILQGNIDAVFSDGSIIDFKTGSYTDESLKAYQKQLITYKYLREINKASTKDLLLYFIEKDELIKVDERAFDIESLDKIAKNILSENIYEKTDDIKLCKYCPMKYYCNRPW